MSYIEEFRRRWQADGPQAFHDACAFVATLARRRVLGALQRHRFGHLGRGSVVEGPRLLTNPRFVHIGDDVLIRGGSRIEAIRYHGGERYEPRMQIGDRTTIEFDVHLACAESLWIGDDVLIAGGVYASDHDHDFRNEAETPLCAPLRVKPTVIGNRCWLGERAVITSGVELGDGCIVGAGAVVTRSFPAGSVIVGVPGRLLRVQPPVPNASEAESGFDE
jgi:acetyltransferase-like isoleucine patch superfamily enzyme